MSRARTAEAAPPRGAGTTPVAPGGVAARWVDVLEGGRLRVAVEAGDGRAAAALRLVLRERGSGAEGPAPVEATGAADGGRQAVLDLRGLAPAGDDPRVCDVQVRTPEGDRPLAAARAATGGPRVVWLDGAALRVRPYVTARGTLAVR